MSSALVSVAEVVPGLGSVPLGRWHTPGRHGQTAQCRHRARARAEINPLGNANVKYERTAPRGWAAAHSQCGAPQRTPSDGQLLITQIVRPCLYGCSETGPPWLWAQSGHLLTSMPLSGISRVQARIHAAQADPANRSAEGTRRAIARTLVTCKAVHTWPESCSAARCPYTLQRRPPRSARQSPTLDGDDRAADCRR